MLSKTTLAGTAGAVVTTSRYDEARAGFFNGGKLSSVTNPAATIRYDYDANARKLRDTYVIDGRTLAVGVAYDVGGRVLYKTYPDGDSAGTAAAPWTYDGAGRLKAIPGVITSATYNARGQTVNIVYGNGVSTAFAYSPARAWMDRVTTSGSEIGRAHV